MSRLTFILCDVYLSLSRLVGKTVCSICTSFLNYYLNDAACFYVFILHYSRLLLDFHLVKVSSSTLGVSLL